MLLHIEHIGIAVKDLDRSEELYSRLFNVQPYKRETVTSESVSASFLRVKDMKIELLQSTDPDGVIARFIEKKGEGFHHIAYEVDDILAEMERLTKEGFVLLNDVPKRGADNKLVCFLHPQSANGLLVELCQEINQELV